MSTFKKSVLWCVIIVLLAGLAFSGCSKKTEEEQQPAKNEEVKENNKEEEKKEEKKEPVVVELVHYQTGQQAVIQEMADIYFEKTGVKVEQTLIDGKAAKQFLMTRAQEGKFPDIYGGSLGGEQLANLVNAGLVLDLTSEWEEWAYEKLGEEKSYKAYLAPDNQWGAKSGKYGIPYVVATSAYFYNMKMLKDAGVDAPPKTWAEFVDLCEKLKAKNYTPAAFNFGQNWGVTNQILFPYATNIFGGEQEFYKVMRSEDCFKDERWLKVFGALEELRDKEYLLEGSVVMNMPDCENKFINKEVAIITNGSWFVPLLKEKAADVEWAVAPPPAVVEGNKVCIDGGVSTSFTLSSKNEHVKESIEFIKWFVDAEQQKTLAEKAGVLPANPAGMKEADIDENVKQFAALGSNLTQYRGHELAGEAGIYEELWKGVQSLVEGKKSSEQLMQDLQEALESK